MLCTKMFVCIKGKELMQSRTSIPHIDNTAAITAFLKHPCACLQHQATTILAHILAITIFPVGRNPDALFLSTVSQDTMTEIPILSNMKNAIIYIIVEFILPTNIICGFCWQYIYSFTNLDSIAVGTKIYANLFQRAAITSTAAFIEPRLESTEDTWSIEVADPRITRIKTRLRGINMARFFTHPIPSSHAAFLLFLVAAHHTSLELSFAITTKHIFTRWTIKNARQLDHDAFLPSPALRKLNRNALRT